MELFLKEILLNEIGEISNCIKINEILSLKRFLESDDIFLDITNKNNLLNFDIDLELDNIYSNQKRIDEENKKKEKNKKIK